MANNNNQISPEQAVHIELTATINRVAREWGLSTFQVVGALESLKLSLLMNGMVAIRIDPEEPDNKQQP